MTKNTDIRGWISLFVSPLQSLLCLRSEVAVVSLLTSLTVEWAPKASSFSAGLTESVSPSFRQLGQQWDPGGLGAGRCTCVGDGGRTKANSLGSVLCLTPYRHTHTFTASRVSPNSYFCDRYDLCLTLQHNETHPSITSLCPVCVCSSLKGVSVLFDCRRLGLNCRKNVNMWEMNNTQLLSYL